MDARDYLQDDIENLGFDEILDKFMYKYVNKTVNDNIIDKKVCQLIRIQLYILSKIIKGSANSFSFCLTLKVALFKIMSVVMGPLKSYFIQMSN